MPSSIPGLAHACSVAHRTPQAQRTSTRARRAPAAANGGDSFQSLSGWPCSMRASHRASAAVQLLAAGEPAQQHPRPRSCVLRPPENAPRAPHEHKRASRAMPPLTAPTASQDDHARCAPRIGPQLPCSFSQLGSVPSSIPGVAHACSVAHRTPQAHRTSFNALYARRLLAAVVTASQPTPLDARLASSHSRRAASHSRGSCPTAPSGSFAHAPSTKLLATGSI